MTTRKTTVVPELDHRHTDPLSGEAGAHPVGVTIGAASAGAAAGALGGAVGGPIGAAVGAVVGAVAGGLTGKAAAESMDPTVEDTYWRANYQSRPYVPSGATYDEYQPAYRYGWESRSRFNDRNFDEVEADLAQDWEHSRGTSKLTWDKAKRATRDAWNRL